MMNIYTRLREKQAALYARLEGNEDRRDVRRTYRALDEVEHIFALVVHANLDLIDLRREGAISIVSPFAATEVAALRRAGKLPESSLFFLVP